MLDLLLQLDKGLFIFINHLPHNIFLNYLFSFFSGIGTWGIVWFAIGLALFIWEELKDKKGLIALAVACLFIILFVDGGLKNFIKRPRPEFSIEKAIVVFDRRGTYSFPSGHAALAFAAAYILAKEHKKWSRWYYLLAFLIAFSRIYLGKHYPSDVIFGGLTGIFIGMLSLKLIPLRGKR